MDENLGCVWTQSPPWPALPSPYIVLIIIRIKCVLVQYITVVIGMLCTAFHIDLTLLNGKPCLICSGSSILILFWKGVVNTVWRRDERGEGRREWTNEREDGGWILPSALFFLHPVLFFVSLFSLMSVLSVDSRCESVALIYTHTATLYNIHHAKLSFCGPLCASVFDWRGGCWCFWRH